MINHLFRYIPKSLKREFHHYRTNRDDDGGFEPAMTILNVAKPGKSFIILQEALFKYLDPKDNFEILQADREEFEKLKAKVLNTITLTNGLRCTARAQALDDMATIILAEKIHQSTGILPCVCYNLVKCLRMFDITVCPASAAQLLMWVQDGLDELKNMPDAPSEKELTAGEVTLWEGGRKVATKDLTVKESDLITEGNA